MNILSRNDSENLENWIKRNLNHIGYHNYILIKLVHDLCMKSHNFGYNMGMKDADEFEDFEKDNC